MTPAPVALDDKFDLRKERVFLTGVQALVRLTLMRAELDRRAGLNTAGYVTGYRGSPLGALDRQFPLAQEHLDAADIVFEPAINEDLAATALWGTQQAEMRGEGRYDGVFGMWYGKGPGVDRSGDVFRHANLAGTSPHGGVLVLTGDDHTCESSTTAHQSEYALMDAMIPVLNPANIQEILDYGLHGWELSRFAGLWCGLKGVKDNVESSASIRSSLSAFRSIRPEDFTPPPDGLNIRPQDTPQAQEARLHRHKIAAALAYARANGLDRVELPGGGGGRIGIVSTGKSFMDVLQAIDDLRIDRARAAELGLGLFKVAMSWPLEPTAARAFAESCDLLIVVEEKRGLIEGQLRQLLYRSPASPVIIGKEDERGASLFPAESALNPVQVAVAVGERLVERTGDAELRERVEFISGIFETERSSLAFERKPYFCAGCPHNISTNIPEGARGYAGIGCHWMAQFMDRRVEGYTHMGGEGANWIGESRFSKRKHVFQNIGDGTFNHSGVLALRAAVASGARMTFKILYNDAVAMTGGQGHDGSMGVVDIAAEVAALGIRPIVLVSDRRDRERDSSLPRGVRVRNRAELDAVQRELAAHDGVSVLIYDQTCAAEKRRRRKRGQMPDPDRRIFINARVCEGCGDCGVQSNCVAIAPLETEFGRKRQIDQSSCNKDYSCVEGFCPSFVSVEGGELRRPELPETAPAGLPDPPDGPSLEQPYAIAVTGVGGTGVVTITALLGMAAHLEGKGCGIIDMAGLAQKGGAVISHLKIGATPEDIRSMRIGVGSADLLLGCDIVVSASDAIIRMLRPDRSQAMINSHEMATGAFTRDPDIAFPASLMQERLRRATGKNGATFVNATAIARALLGDTIAANLFLLGAAVQRGQIPVGLPALERAIELNGVAVELNLRALRLGRQWACEPTTVEAQIEGESVARKTTPATLDAIIERRFDFLTEYQDRAYARRYRELVERACAVDSGSGQAFARAVANSAFKLMAYKDEYEVARLYTDGEFARDLARQFSGGYRLRLFLAPPLISRPRGTDGRIPKRLFGPWIFPVLRALAPLKRLRGTPFDLFGYSAERRLERDLVRDYATLVDELCGKGLTADYETAVEIAELPNEIRGYGHVKLRAVERYRERQRTLLARIRGHSPNMEAAA